MATLGSGALQIGPIPLLPAQDHAIYCLVLLRIAAYCRELSSSRGRLIARGSGGAEIGTSARLCITGKNDVRVRVGKPLNICCMQQVGLVQCCM
jgi:hypothetical protein